MSTMEIATVRACPVCSTAIEEIEALCDWVIDPYVPRMATWPCGHEHDAKDIIVGHVST